MYLLVRLGCCPAAALFDRFAFLSSKNCKKLHQVFPLDAGENVHNRRLTGKKINKIITKIRPAVCQCGATVLVRAVRGAPTGWLADWESEEEMEGRAARWRRGGEERRREGRASLRCAHWVDEESGQQAHK